MKKVKMTTKCIVQFKDEQVEIKVNKGELASLTDLWKRAGSPDSKRPKDWLYTKEAQDFVQHIKNLKGEDSPLLEIAPGRNGGTYADLQITLKYGQWLSPEFQKTVNDVFIERKQEEIDPELGVQRAVERHEKRLKAIGRDDAAIAKRLKTVAKRNTLTSTLQDHGVTGSKFFRDNGFLRVTEAEYLGWKGKHSWDMKKELGVDKGNLRDHLSEYELDQLAFLEATLEHKIKQENVYGNDQCANMAHGVGKAVSKMVENVMRQAIT